MKALPFRSVPFLAFATGLFVSSITVADDPITQVQVLENPGQGFTLETDIDGDVSRAWFTAANETTVMFRRSIPNTLSPAFHISHTPAADVFTADAPWEFGASGKTCCSFSCDDGRTWKLNPLSRDCDQYGRGCQICELLCTDGWTNCPAGSTDIIDLRAN